MARVRSKNTVPELAVRSLLHRLGYRFRLHRADLPGKPDVTLPARKTVIFVHGCFWHQHNACRLADRPVSNREYWDAKLDRNVARDAANKSKLRKLGWKVIIVWECQIKIPERLSKRLVKALGETHLVT